MENSPEIKGRIFHKIGSSEPPFCPIIFTKLARILHKNELIKCAKFGLFALIGVCSAGHKIDLILFTRCMTFSNLSCTRH